MPDFNNQQKVYFRYTKGNLPCNEGTFSCYNGNDTIQIFWEERNCVVVVPSCYVFSSKEECMAFEREVQKKKDTKEQNEIETLKNCISDMDGLIEYCLLHINTEITKKVIQQKYEEMKVKNEIFFDQ